MKKKPARKRSVRSLRKTVRKASLPGMIFSNWDSNGWESLCCNARRAKMILTHPFVDGPHKDLDDPEFDDIFSSLRVTR